MRKNLKIISSLITASMLFTACSSKNETITKIEQHKKKKIANNINLNSSKNLFKAYIDKDDKIQFICKVPYDCNYYNSKKHSNLNSNPDEEFFYINQSGYNPKISKYTRDVQCGRGSMFGWLAIFTVKPFGIQNHNKKNPDVCYNRYTKVDSSQIGTRIFAGLLTFGTPFITAGNMHTRMFDASEFKESLSSSKVEFFRKELIDKTKSYKINGGFDIVYLEEGDIDDSLEDKYESLLDSKSKKEGVIFLDYDTNDFLALIVFDRYKNRHLIKNISQQVSDVLSSVSKKSVYHLEDSDILRYIPDEIDIPTLPPIPKLTKSEFEKKSAFKKRVEDAVQKREEQIRELQRQYSLDVFERNAYIDNLQKGFANYIKYKSEEKDELSSELKENIDLLSKVLFLENISSYEAKDFEYDAESEKMYFTIYTQNGGFSQKVFAKMDPSNAKAIKLKEKYKVIPNIEFKKGYLRLNSFNILDTLNDDSFKVKYTNIKFKPESIKVNIFTNKEEIDKELSNTFKKFKQKDKKINDEKVTIAYKDVVSRINARVPKWFENPILDDRIISYGEANSLSAANSMARKELAYKIKVKVNSSYENTKEISDIKSFSLTKKETRQISNIQLKAGDYRTFKQEKVDGRWYVALQYTKK